MKFLLILLLLVTFFISEFIFARSKYSNSNNNTQANQRYTKESNDLYSIKNFNCNLQRTTSQAYSVHHLKPSDIAVVAALGDSITAGLFAKSNSLLDVVFTAKMKLEYRGISFSIGGDNNSTTLPNLLKKYNPSLKGFAIHSGVAGDVYSGYDFAISGAKSLQLYSQTEKLISKLRENNLEDEWKIITIMIGANDLCAVCKNSEKFSPENYYKHIKTSIDNLANNLTRTFINLLQIVDVYKVHKLATTNGCTAVQGMMSFFGICKCMNDASISTYHKQYVQTIWDLETYFKGVFNDRDDFAVVVQPFFEDSSIPEIDPLSYFAPDCFHFSQKGHTVAAISLWNNMIMPSKYKSTYLNDDLSLKCPLKYGPYFYTYKTNEYLTDSKLTKKNPIVLRKLSRTISIMIFTISYLFITFSIIVLVALFTLLTYFRKNKSRNKYYQL